MLVKDVMKIRAASIRNTSDMYHAAEIVALSDVSDLMVIDAKSNFLGVLSEGDILRALMPDLEEIKSAGGSLQEAYRLFVSKGDVLSEHNIMPFVVKDPIIISPDQHVAQAATIFIDKKLRRLPVVEKGKLKGTISRADVCRALIGTV